MKDVKVTASGRNTGETHSESCCFLGMKPYPRLCYFLRHWGNILIFVPLVAVVILGAGIIMLGVSSAAITGHMLILENHRRLIGLIFLPALWATVLGLIFQVIAVILDPDDFD